MPSAEEVGLQTNFVNSRADRDFLHTIMATAPVSTVTFIMIAEINSVDNDAPAIHCRVSTFDSIQIFLQ